MSDDTRRHAVHGLCSVSEKAPPPSWLTAVFRRSDSDCHGGLTVGPRRRALLLERVEVQLRLAHQVFVRAVAGTEHLQVHTPCRRVGVE